MSRPSTSSSQDSGFDEAFGFGAIEVCCFLALLSAVVFFGGVSSNFLVTVVVARALCLFGAWPEVDPAKSVGVRFRRALSFVLLGLAYQIPFWLSLGTLPIRGLDQGTIGQALLGQVLILFLAVVLSALLPWVNLLALGGFLALGGTVCILTFWPLERTLLLLGGALGLLWQFEKTPYRVPLEREETWFLGGLAAGSWVTFLALMQTARFPGEDLVGRLLLPWLLLNFLGSQLFAWSRGEEIEFENGVDQLSAARHHWALRSLCARRLAASICLALLFLAWIPWNAKALATLALFYLAWDRALSLSVSRRASQEVAAWWSFGEFVLLLAALLVVERWLAVVIVVSALSSLLVGAWGRRSLNFGEKGTGFFDLGDALKVAAPTSLNERLSREIEMSPHLENDLATTAPVGFRDRLLGRLRQRDLDEGEEEKS